MVEKSPRKKSKSYNILLVEPNPDTVSPLIEFFETEEVTDEIVIVSSGDEAVDFINQRNEYEDAPRPNLVFLDLHLPDTSGLSILAEINDHSTLRPVPVIVLTTSDEAERIAQSYELHANAYIRKPDSSDQYTRLGQAIKDFWLDHVLFPPNGQ